MKKGVAIAFILVVIILVVYEALITYDNKFKHGRMWETPAIKPHEKEPLIMEAGVVPFQGGEAIYRATRGEELKYPIGEGDMESIRLGSNLYFTYCVHCHGKYHDGYGTVGQSFHPLPGDLRGKKVQSLPEGVIFKEISYGIPKGRQPALATTIDMMDRWRIIAYLKSLGPRTSSPNVEGSKTRAD